MKKGEKSKKGFTIIEVALVLAIAGLIFLMVFIALPALQRQQRDTARQEDINALVAAIKKYQSNNRGALPGGSDRLPLTGVTYDINYNGENNKTTWKGFLRNYMDEGFVDPAGESYSLQVAECGGSKADEVCTVYSRMADVTNNKTVDYKLYIIQSAKCAGDEAKGALKTSNPRRIAVLYRLENNGLFCADA